MNHETCVVALLYSFFMTPPHNVTSIILSHWLTSLQVLDNLATINRTIEFSLSFEFFGWLLTVMAGWMVRQSMNKITAVATTCANFVNGKPSITHGLAHRLNVKITTCLWHLATDYIFIYRLSTHQPCHACLPAELTLHLYIYFIPVANFALVPWPLHFHKD